MPTGAQLDIIWMSHIPWCYIKHML